MNRIVWRRKKGDQRETLQPKKIVVVEQNKMN